MANKKIIELDAASQVNSDALFAVSQQVSGEQKTLKGTVGQVGEYIGGTQTFSGLNTTSKNLVGAINEVAQGGGGSGGHTILDNEGDALTQRDNLQFVGAYSEDASTKTVVNVVRSMTQAQFNQLSSDEKVGLINVTDATLPLAEEIDYDNTTSGLSADNIQDAVDELASEKMDKADPTGTGSLSLNRKSGTTVGANSVAEGLNCTASGASSHAEGSGTNATATASHAEGGATTASELYSHSEGYSTIASGARSHAEGSGTKANRRSQHVFGEYNIEETGTTTTKGTYIEIVGNGTTDTNRSNARTLDWSGNEVLAGGLKINGSDDIGIAPVGYNANTDRDTESVRQTAMRYLRTNCFIKGGASSSVRYSGGYYFTYLFGGVTSYGYDTFVEFAQSLTSGEKIIYWGYNVSTDTFTKLFSV